MKKEHKTLFVDVISVMMMLILALVTSKFVPLIQSQSASAIMVMILYFAILMYFYSWCKLFVLKMLGVKQKRSQLSFFLLNAILLVVSALSVLIIYLIERAVFQYQFLKIVFGFSLLVLFLVYYLQINILQIRFITKKSFHFKKMPKLLPNYLKRMGLQAAILVVWYIFSITLDSIASLLQFILLLLLLWFNMLNRAQFVAYAKKLDKVKI